MQILKQAPALGPGRESLASLDGLDELEWDIPQLNSAVFKTSQHHSQKKPPMPNLGVATATFPVSEHNKHFKALDALRGVAALAVSALHLERGDYFLRNWNGVYAPALYLGLDFFLVLSGFVLSQAYMFAEHPVPPMQFLLQRIMRLWPMHALAVVTTAVARRFSGMLVLHPVPGVLQDFMMELFMVHCVGFPYPRVAYNNMLSWTVSCEFWINAFFVFSSCRGHVSCAVLMVIGLALQVGLFFETDCLDIWSATLGGCLNLGLVRCSSSFMLGVASFALHRASSGRKLKVFCATILEVVFVLAVLAVVCWRPQHCFGTDFIAPLLFAGTVFTFASEQGWLSWVLVYGAFIGKVSYSIYLNQWTVLFCLKAWGVLDWSWISHSVLLQLALYWSVLLPYACLTYSALERPAMRLFKGRQETDSSVAALRLVPSGTVLHRPPSKSDEQPVA